MRLTPKLMGGFLTVALLTLVVSYFTGMAVQKDSMDNFQEVGGDILPGNIALARMTSELYHTAMMVSRFAEKRDIEDRLEIERSLSTLNTYKTMYMVYQPEDNVLHSKVDGLIQRFSSYITEYILKIQKHGKEEELQEIKLKIEGIVNDFVSSVTPHIENKFIESYKKLEATKQETVNAHRMLVGSGVVIFIIASGLSLFISHFLSRPLIKFRDAALEIGKGKLDINLPATSEDEIGELADAFNNMVGNLSAAQEGLLSANKQLKKEVAERMEAEKEIKTRVRELEEFYDMSVSRELKMKELKEEIKKLKAQSSTGLE